MKRSTRIILVLVLIALFPVVIKLQALIDPQRKQFQPGRGVASVMTEVGNTPVVLPSQFIAGTLIGFREVVAGLLWIRVNDFFHSGNYEAIIPLTRIITWLDPHQIEVYRTGAWHLAYNFVDSKERADRRYLAPAIKFLEEGIANNPGVSDLPFDLGFVLYYLKAQDFDKAVYWISKACEDKDTMLPMYRTKAHALEKAGRIDDCVEQWRFCIRQAEAALKKDPKDWRAMDHLQVSKRNLDMTLVRKVMRVDLDKHRLDAGFEASFKRLGPRVFLVSGKTSLPDESRVELVLSDADYKEPNMKTFNWDLDPNVTVLTDVGIHGLYVEKGKFARRYDLTKDAKQYRFKKDKYILTLSFNPRTAPDFIQDRLGWSGEGLTAKKYLDLSTPGVRKLRKVIYLNRDDIL